MVGVPFVAWGGRGRGRGRKAKGGKEIRKKGRKRADSSGGGRGGGKTTRRGRYERLAEGGVCVWQRCVLMRDDQ